MDEPIHAPKRGVLYKLARLIQWIVFAVFALFAIAFAGMEMPKAGIPGAPVGMLYFTIAVLAIFAVSHIPPLLFRISGKGKLLAYAAIIPVLILFGVYHSQMAPVWEATPEGAKEARERQAEAEQAFNAEAQRKEAEQRLTDAKAAIEEASTTQQKLERCFSSWGHRLSALENPVKDSLHNPKAFEHVETDLIVPDADGRNVVMRFRAENGFGAIRTGSVRAKLYAEDCSVDDISEPEVE